MQIDLTPEMVANWVGDILRIKPHLNGDDIEFDFSERRDWNFQMERRRGDETPSNPIRKISVTNMHAIFENLRKKEEYQDSGVFDRYSYEVLVTEETPFRISRLRSDNFILEDIENGITYTLSAPSDDYYIYLLNKVSQIASVRLIPNISSAMRMGRMIGDEDKSALDIAKSFSPRIMTLQVTSKKPKNISDFVKHANSFFFHLSYNLDVAIVPQRYFDDLVRKGRLERVRRVGIDELTPPSRFYYPDLVHYYQEGVASDSPPLQYLSFYHVAEHFFEAIYNDELIERVKQIITQPDFSYKRKKDVKGLINKIGKWVSFRSETMTFNEQEALALTLQNFVNLDTLIQKIKEYDETLIEYYNINSVIFSGGESVDLEANDQQNTWLQLSKRIYKTRNAIVHSKESEKGKYTPFEHEKILVKEVPLIRFIAELIIISSSTIIE